MLWKGQIDKIFKKENYNSDVASDTMENTRWRIADNLWDVEKSINWDFSRALNYLKRSCTKVDKWIERYWKSFNKVSIKLPNWDNREFFVETWDGCCNGKQFKENKCNEYSFSRRDISSILDSIKKFLISVWVTPNERVTFENKHGIDRSEICLMKLLWLPTADTFSWDEKSYRLKDKLFSLYPEYYMLTPYKEWTKFSKWLWEYNEAWFNNVWKLLLKSLPESLPN